MSILQPHLEMPWTNHKSFCHSFQGLLHMLFKLNELTIHTISIIPPAVLNHVAVTLARGEGYFLQETSDPDSLSIILAQDVVHFVPIILGPKCTTLEKAIFCPRYFSLGSRRSCFTTPSVTTA